MPVHYDKVKAQYRFTFNRVINGKRFRANKRLPKDWTKREAEKYAREEEGRLFALATGVRQEPELIEDALAHYLKHKTFKDETVPEELARMYCYYQGKTIDELKQVAEQYRADYPGHSAATFRHKVGYIRAGVKWAFKHGYTRTAPPDVPLPRLSNERHVYLRIDDQIALLDAIESIEARALFTLCFWTGCRWEKEILTLTQDKIIRNGDDVFIDIGVTKNGRRKRKYVREEARWCLAYIPWRHARTWYYRRFNAARDKAGLSGYRIHDMRHSLASEIISNGGTLSDVGAVLGHESHQSSARYAHLYPERQMEVLKKVGKK